MRYIVAHHISFYHHAAFKLICCNVTQTAILTKWPIQVIALRCSLTCFAAYTALLWDIGGQHQVAVGAAGAEAIDG
jgi:hypothetical protein